MFLRKHITGAMALVILLVQLALAQHFTVHFQEEEYTALLSHGKTASLAQDSGSQNKQDDNKPDPDKICQICVYSKHLNHAVLAATPDLPTTTIATSFVTAVFHVRPRQFERPAYFGRGPPTALS